MGDERDISPPRKQKWKISNLFEPTPPWGGGNHKHAGRVSLILDGTIAEFRQGRNPRIRRYWGVAKYGTIENCLRKANKFAAFCRAKNDWVLNQTRLIAPGVIEMRIGKETTIFDECNLEKVQAYTWACEYDTHTNYAVSQIKTGGRYKQIRLHRLITEAGEGTKVDHKKRNGLNNLMSNLIVSTSKVNCNNKNLMSTNKSGFNGVRREKVRRIVYWKVSYMENGKAKTVRFRVWGHDEEDAMQKAIACRREADIRNGCTNGWPVDE